MDIPNVGFKSPLGEHPEFEVLDLHYQRAFSKLHPDKPHRVQFFNLIYIESAQDHHMIDFKEYPYSDNSVIFVQLNKYKRFTSFQTKGKIVEHWDTIEEIPAKSEWKNSNGKFGFQ